MSAMSPENRLRVVFFGSPEFAVPSLSAVAARHQVLAVVTQPDRPAGRGKKLAPPPVKELAVRLGLPVEQPTTLKDGALAATLAALKPDLFVVVAYGRILPPSLLTVPPLGPWNVHASLLPKYRGAAPIQWAIIRGETRTGVCVMRMEAGLDTGPVAACSETAIGEDETAGALAVRLSQLGAELLVETLPRIASGAAPLVVQDHAAATLAPILRKEDGQLDFARPAREVSTRARGVDPWPGPGTTLEGEPLKLFAPRVVDREGAASPPGTVLYLALEGLVVQCAPGAVAFAELQLAGRKRLPAAAVLAGRPIPPGTRLG
jgi:methionyl-tRNA formyltransferase